MGVNINQLNKINMSQIDETGAALNLLKEEKSFNKNQFLKWIKDTEAAIGDTRIASVLCEMYFKDILK